ncbi:hypothetical protein [Puniceicoccus vermicola]
MPLQDTRDPIRVQPGKAEAMPHCGWVASAPTAQWQDQTIPHEMPLQDTQDPLRVQLG